MAYGDYLAKIRLALEGKERVVQGLAETQRAAMNLSRVKVTTLYDKEGIATGRKLEEVFKNTGQQTQQAAARMGDFEKALRRVVIVAPVWMAARAVIQGTLATIRDGFRTWVDFDRALIKSKAVIHDYAGTTDEAMQVLESSIRSFSRESGISLDKLTSSFYRFGTVGIAFQDALSGAIASAKLATATLGDTDTISRSLAMAYRLLGDTIDKSLTPMQKQESLAGKIYKLWQSNAFEANEFAQSLNNFVSTANVANFTADQTVSLLAALGTAGVQGTKGGRLLKTSIFKLVENLDMLASTLGLAVNPEMENTFDLFMRVLDAINKLSQTTGIPVEAMKAIQEIFGGVRGAQAISALNALLPEVRQNLIDMGKDPQEFIKGLNDRMDEVKDTVSKQLDIFSQLRAQLGEAFVKGAVGANDFKDALKNQINPAMEEMINIAGEIGKFLYGITHPILSIKKGIKDMTEEEENFWKRVQDAEDGQLSLIESTKLLVELEKRIGRDAWGKDLIDRIKETQKQIAIAGQIEAKWEKAIRDFNENVIQKENKRVERTKKISSELQEQLSLNEKELELIKKQAKGMTDVEVAQENLNNLIAVLVDKHNKLIYSGGKQVEQVSAQEVLAAILAGDYEKVLNLFKGMELSEKEINSLAAARNTLEKANTKEYVDQEKSFRSLVLQFEKATASEQDRLRRVTELMGLAPEELAKRAEEDVYDRDIILDYWNYFSDSGQKAVEDVLAKMNELAIPRYDEDVLKESLDELEKASAEIYNRWPMTRRVGAGGEVTGGVPAVAAPMITAPVNVTPISNFDMLMNITGGITREDLQNILQKVKDEIEKHPSYVGDIDELTDKIIGEIGADEGKQSVLGRALREKI